VKPAEKAKKKAAFLRALVGSTVHDACVRAKMSRQTAYQWREQDEAFAATWEMITEADTDRLEKNTMDLAERGDIRKLYYKGDPIWEVDGNGEPKLDEQGLKIQAFEHVRYTQLMQFTLERRRAAYRPHSTLSVEGKVTGVIVAPAEVEPEEWAREQTLRNGQASKPE